MGLKELLAGRGTRVRPVSLRQGETELCREVASARPGTLTSVGGDLVLTDRRLIFTPLETVDAVEVLTWGLRKARAPGPVAELPGRLGELVQQHDVGGADGLRGIASVTADDTGGWLRPPTVCVYATDGSTTEIGILGARRASNRDRSNVAARDRMAAAIRVALPG